MGFSVLSLLCPGGGSLPKSCPLQQPRESQDEPRWPPAPGASGVSLPGLQLQNHRAAQVHGLPQEMRALAASGEAEASVKRAPGSQRPQRAPRPSCECAMPDAGPWGRKLQDSTRAPSQRLGVRVGVRPARCPGGGPHRRPLGPRTTRRTGLTPRRVLRGQQPGHGHQDAGPSSPRGAARTAAGGACPCPVLAACPCHLFLSPVFVTCPCRSREKHASPAP